MAQSMHSNTLLGIMIIMMIRPLFVRLSQMTGYARKFVENATM